MKFRVGFGFDVHRLVEGRALWLGGIMIDAKKKCNLFLTLAQIGRAHV